MANKTSQHILGTSANLLGFCLVVITSLHITGKHQNTWIDEFTSIIALFLTISCILSFGSLRTQHAKREKGYEGVAELFFLVALIGLIGIIGFIAVTFWNK